MVDMELTTQHIITALENAELSGAKGDISYRGVSTDTRGDCRECLFVALVGENFDGNTFLVEAQKAGALGAVIGPSAEGQAQPASLQLFKVPDTLAALQKLAVFAIKLHSGCRRVAVTGSNGKSTTKQLIASILERRYRIHASAGSFNNHIGVPLTLLGVEPETEVLITELGANHPGEIRSLARLVAPEVSVITNVAPAHLEGFGSIEGVLKAKLELFEETAENGVRIYNGDDNLLKAEVKKRFRNTMSFGLGEDNDLAASNISLDNSARPSLTFDGSTRITLNCTGRHNVLNALAAAAVGLVFGLEKSEIKKGLESFRPLKMRTELKKIGRTLVLDDSYNANPFSMREALNTLEAVEHQGPRAAVLGEMLELGAEAEKLHTDLAREIARRSLKFVILVGRFAEKMKEAYISAGGDKRAVFTASDAASCWEILKSELAGGELLLVKASRGLHLERIIDQLEKESA